MNRKDLSDALSKVNTCVVENKVIPIFSHISFRNDTIQSFNGAQGVSVHFNHGLDFTIKSDILTKLVNSYTATDIDLSSKTDKAVLKCGKSHNNIAVLNNSEFISPFDVDIKDKVKIPFTEELYGGIKKCYTSISKNVIKETQNGITLRTVGKKVFLYSTDGNRISKYETGIPLKSKVDVLLPEKFCKILLSLYEKDDDNYLVIAESFMLARFPNNCRVFSNYNTELKLYDFESVMKKYDIENAVFQKLPDEFTDAIKRSMIILENEKEKVLTFQIDEDTVNLISGSSLSDMDEEVIFTYKIGKMSFNIDAELLNESIKEIKEVAFKQVDKDYLVVGKDKNYIVMIGNI